MGSYIMDASRADAELSLACSQDEEGDSASHDRLPWLRGERWEWVDVYGHPREGQPLG